MSLCMEKPTCFASIAKVSLPTRACVGADTLSTVEARVLAHR